MKVLKIAVGSTAAIMIAYSMGLNYAISAGIVALLSLQDTKKATLSVAFMRIVAFAIALVISFVVFSIFSYTIIAFGFFILIFAGICYQFKMFDAISINAVLVTHYFLEQDMSFAMVRNGALLLLIGAGLGILLNIYMPNNIKQIRKKQSVIEADLKSILSEMADKILIEDKTDYGDKSLEKLKEHIVIGIDQAYTNMDNSFFQESKYYIEYMEMRHQQYNILKEIYEKINKLTSVTTQSFEIAEFIRNIAETLSESQNVKGLLEKEDALLLKYKESTLPISREEFENRAILHVILMEFQMFLHVKKEFIDALTEEQKSKYW